MLKSNSHTYGLLKNQYKSVLKKCAILNALAAILVSGMPSIAHSATIDIPNDASGTATNWAGGNNYNVGAADVVNLKGEYKTNNTLAQPYINDNGAIISILGYEVNGIITKTAIEEKYISLTNAGLIGGFIHSTNSTGSITINSGSFSNDDMNITISDTATGGVIAGGAVIG